MSKLKTLIILSLVFNSALFAQTGQNIKNLSAIEFKKAIDSGKYLLIDVRTPGEFSQGHISGAINIDVYDNSFSTKMMAATVKNKSIAIYCRSGRRSKAAISSIATKNLQIIDLNYGIISWQQTGFKIVNL